MFKVEFTDNGDVDSFLGSIPEKAKNKFLICMKKTEQGISGAWFKKMPGTKGLWEFRIQHMKMWYRIFAFLHKSTEGIKLVLCTNGITKDQNKTPKKDIVRAERIKKEYLDSLE